MSKLVETEIKIYMPDLDAITARLAQIGAAEVKPRVYEHNIRYEDAANSLSPSGMVLRMRQDTRARLTFKAPPAEDADLPANVRTRFEAEVTVDNFETMDLILRRLGYHPNVVYEKYRTTYDYGEVEIVLDEMPFGNFIEVEGPAEGIESALAALGLADAPRILGSYMDLFARVKLALGLAAHDLTFANFDGIDVPPELFYGVD
ncbi:class IV adenylate cyclase [Aggregatilinea lenta]|uniref:class IV adenylate cyclase n=1 Tax=Aggregatilinea lenta TaxID=913108 RepID=UPI000E5B856B|nr:class IV adenylate cyclase [Aggregatilinea lenta]